MIDLANKKNLVTQAEKIVIFTYEYLPKIHFECYHLTGIRHLE